MPLTLLQMVQKAQAELGLPQTASVIGSSDATTQQMLALANRCLDELRQMKDDGWTALQAEYDLAVPVAQLATGDASAGSTTIQNMVFNTVGFDATQMTPTYAWTLSGTNVVQSSRVVQILSATSVVISQPLTNEDPLIGGSYQFAQDTFAEPDGFDSFVNRTMWDRTNHWELIGPDGPQIDEWHRSGIVTTGPRRHFRQIGPGGDSIGTPNFRLWPPPFELVSPLDLVFEYVSENSVVAHGDFTALTRTQYFNNDDDQCLLNDNAIIMGIKWMFWEIKGMGSYVTLQNRWVDYVQRLIARDGAAPTLQLSKRQSPVFISPANVQDGFFPGPSGQSGI